MIGHSRKVVAIKELTCTRYFEIIRKEKGLTNVFLQYILGFRKVNSLQGRVKVPTGGIAHEP